MKTHIRDWSFNMEDEHYAGHPEEALADAVEAVETTMAGVYVNLVTHADLGHPEEGFIPQLEEKLKEVGIGVREIRYIDQCGCGGYVTRVYR